MNPSISDLMATDIIEDNDIGQGTLLVGTGIGRNRKGTLLVVETWYRPSHGEYTKTHSGRPERCK